MDAFRLKGPPRRSVEGSGVGGGLAQDGGSAIKGYHIDTYNGSGNSVCVPWPYTNQSVTFVSY